MNDYSEARERLTRVRAALAEAHIAAGRANLPPVCSPRAARTQIDEVEKFLQEAAVEIEAARSACTQAGRRGLSIV